MACDRGLLNTAQLGIGFFLIFTAYVTCCNIQQFVVSSIKYDRNISGNYTGPPIAENAGYVSSAILFVVFTTSNLLAVPIVDTIGQKWPMIIGGILYLFYITSFLYLTTPFLYVCSALAGFGASIIWVGQGSYLSNNSDKVTATRNAGIFWAINNFSYLIGGLIAFGTFLSERTSSNFLTLKTVNIVYICFSGLAAGGVFVLALLRKSVAECTDNTVSSNVNKIWSNLFGTFKRMFELLITVPQLLIILVYVFTGLERGFWVGVYGTSLANTLEFSTHKQLLALHGIFLGVGGTLGGGIFAVFGKQINRFGYIPIVFLASFSHMLSFALIFINIPFEASIHETNGTPFIHANQYLALLCSFLLGFADACWITQISCMITKSYAKDSAAANGIFRFFQSGASSACFFYTGNGGLFLQWQLLILTISCCLAAFGFFYAQWLLNKQEEQTIDEDEKLKRYKLSVTRSLSIIS